MAQTGTVLQYGPVTMVNVLTKSFRQEPVFASDGNSVQFHRFTIRVVGHVHGDASARLSTVYSTYIDPADTAGHRAALSHRYIRWALMQPRQTFYMKLQNDILLQAFPAQVVSPAPPPSSTNITDIDLNEGPRCLECDVVQITGNQIFRVEATFEICKVECNSGSTATNTSGVLSNTWSCTDDIDSNFFTRRTITGQLRTITALLNPHSFRNFVIPPLQLGMRRESMQFVAAEDGHTLNYTITDVEVAFAPPKPATTWSVKHTESVSRDSSNVGSFVSVDVTLGGDRNCDKNQLISLATAIVEAKVTGIKGKNSRIYLNFAITNEYSDSMSLVHAQATAKRVTDKNIAVIAGIQVDRLKPITNADLATVAAIVGQYDPQKARGNRDQEKLEAYGPIGLVAAFSTYLQSPCSNDHELYKQGLVNPPGEAARGPQANLAAYTTQDIATDNSTSWADDSAGANVLTFYQLESTWERTAMRVQCPIADDSVSSGFSLGGSGSFGASQPTSAIIQLAPSMVSRTIRMSAERVGQPPSLPMPADSFSDGGVNYTLLDSNLLMGAPERDPDGQLVYREQRDFRYAADRDPFVDNSSFAVRIGPNVGDSNGLYSRIFSTNDWNNVA